MGLSIRPLYLCTALAVSVSAGACGGSGGSPPSNPTQPSPARWTLSGVVTNAGSQTPLAGARVEAVDGSNQGRSTQADAQGRYQLDNLQQGSFTIRATADGFEPVARAVELTRNVVIDLGLRPRESRGIAGTTVDGISDRVLGGVTVRIDGVGEAVTAADGTFQFDAADPTQVRAVAISSPVTVSRSTRLRVPGPNATISLMPGTFDLRAFDEMFRGSGDLRRWTSPPRVVFQSRVLQFTNTSDLEYTATSTLMSAADVDELLTDFVWALPQLTGNTFSGFAGEQRETAAEGERVRVSRTGLIVVARYEGLTTATGFWGYTRWAWNSAGEMQSGIVMLDRNFEQSGSPFRRSLRSHELGHALGYNHVTGRDSVMNSSARIEPNSFDRDGAKLAFLRPPLNRSPDTDPDPFTTNLRGLSSVLRWMGMP
jgi:hypothetical protein